MFGKADKQAANPSVSVNDAFSLAAELEGSEVNAIYSYLTSPLNASMYLLKRKIVAAPSKHIDHLVTAGKLFNVSAATMKKLENLKQASPTRWF